MPGIESPVAIVATATDEKDLDAALPRLLPERNDIGLLDAGRIDGS